MIYRVGDGDNPSFDYSSQLKPTKNAESQEKFNLNRQKAQEYAAKKEEKGEDKKLHEKPGVHDKFKDGVRLELSGGINAEKTLAKNDASEAQSTFGKAVLSILQSLLDGIRDFFYRIWNDSPAEAFSEEVTPEEAERYTEEYYAMKGLSPERTEAEGVPPEAAVQDREITLPGTESEQVETPQSYAAAQAARDAKIQGHLRSGDLEQVISLLTDDGRRTVAKNSNLLTYYDKSGKLTQINASDRERILHGDRNMRTL